MAYILCSLWSEVKMDGPGWNWIVQPDEIERSTTKCLPFLKFWLSFFWYIFQQRFGQFFCVLIVLQLQTDQTLNHMSANEISLKLANEVKGNLPKSFPTSYSSSMAPFLYWNKADCSFCWLYWSSIDVFAPRFPCNLCSNVLNSNYFGVMWEE